MMRALIGGLLCVLLLALGYWAYQNFERVEDDVEVGYRGEARRNPYLALTLLFRKLGVAAWTSKSLPGALNGKAATTVFLPRGRSSIKQSENAMLLAWVRRGGHLVVEAEPAEMPDPILEEIGVSREETLHNAGPNRVDKVALPPGNRPYSVEFHASQQLLYGGKSGAALAGGDTSTNLVQIQFGRGVITVLPSFQPLTNRNLARADHADFAWRLAQDSEADRRVVLVRRPASAPSLLAWLEEHASFALVSLALLIGLWLWWIAPRFGPVAPPREPGRRRLLDHLRASGYFHWESGGADRLLKIARDDCEREILQRQPSLYGLSSAKRNARIAELSGMHPKAIASALDAPCTDQAQFTGAIAAMQTLRDHFAGIGRRAA